MVKPVPMDILRDLTPEEHEIAHIMKWVKSEYKDPNGYYHIIFKKGTPERILRQYKRDYEMMLFKTKGDYLIEK